MEAYAATNKKSLKTKGFHASFILRDDLFWGMDECFCCQRRRFAPTLLFFSCLDARKGGKRKSRPLPRPGKLAGYMIDGVGNRVMYQVNFPASAEAAGQFLGLSDGLSVPGQLPRPRQRAFSCLDARKEAKENQGARGTGQVGRVHDRWTGGFGQVGRVHDWRGPDLCHVPGKLPCLGRGLGPRFHSPKGAK